MCGLQCLLVSNWDLIVEGNIRLFSSRFLSFSNVVQLVLGLFY